MFETVDALLGVGGSKSDVRSASVGISMRLENTGPTAAATVKSTS